MKVIFLHIYYSSLTEFLLLNIAQKEYKTQSLTKYYQDITSSAQ